MPGYLESLMNPATMGLLNLGAGLLQASGPSPVPVSTGAAIGQGLQSGLHGYGEAQQFLARKKLMEQQGNLYAAQAAAYGQPPAPRTQADATGMLRYVDGPLAGQVVPGFNTPRAPEGFRIGPDGQLSPIPEYWEAKRQLAEAGRPTTTIENYPNPVPVVGADGKPRMVQFGKSGAVKETPFTPYQEPRKPSDVELSASGYASRMQGAEKIMGEIGPVGNRTLTTEVASKIPLVGAYVERKAMTPEQQQVRQAQEDWVRAKLRKESGAVIADDEMNREITTYFPMPGDSPEVMAQKERSRQTAIEAMVKASANAAPSKPAASKTAPKSKQFKLDNGDAVIGILEPSTGKYYVVRGGKKFYIEE